MDPAAVVAADPRLKVARSFTEEQRRGFAFALSRGKSRTGAARAVGVSYGTVLRALEADPVFAAAVADAEAEKWDLGEEKLFEALSAGEPWAVKLVVKESAGARERWKPADAVAVGVVEVGPGLERVLALEAGLRERAAVLDVSGRESGAGVPSVPEREEPPAT